MSESEDREAAFLRFDWMRPNFTAVSWLNTDVDKNVDAADLEVRATKLGSFCISYYV